MDAFWGWLGNKKEHASADWVGYGLRAHLQWASLFGWGTTQGITVAAAAVNSHILLADE